MRIAEQFTAWRYLTPRSHGGSLVIVVGDVPSEAAAGLFPLHIQPSVVHYNKTSSSRSEAIGSAPLADRSVGMACVVCSESSVLKDVPLRELHRVVNAGGGVCFLVSTRARLQSLRRILALHGFDLVQAYAVLPYFKAPRWIVPLSPRLFVSSAESVFRPTKPLKWLMWHVAVRLSYTGIVPLVAADRLVIGKRRDGGVQTQEACLRSLVQGFLADGQPEFSLLVRAKKYYVKTTAQVMDQEGRIVAYAKIAETPQAKRLSQNEAAVLRELEQLKLQTADVPRLISFGEVDGDTVLLQEAKHPLKPGPVRLCNQHIAFLAELLNRTGRRWKFEESSLFSSLCGDTQGLRRSDCDGWSTLLQRTAEGIRRRFAGQEMQLGLAHKDFAPWNTCLNKEGQLVVFDWELAHDEAAPLMDFYNFAVHYEGFLRGKKGKQILAALLSEKGPYSALLARYRDAIDGGPQFDHVGLLMVYLYETATYYLDYRMLQAQAGFDLDRSAEHLLSILRTMLRGVQELC